MLSACICLDFMFVYRFDEIVNSVESDDVDKKESDYGERVDHGIAVHECIKDIVRRTVASHKEHIIIVDRDIGNVRGDAEARKDAEGDRDILFLHTCHTRDSDIKRGKARDRMRDSGGNVID